MELRDYWNILRRWYWLLVIGIIVSAGASYTISKMMTPIYAATVTLQVNQVQNPGTPVYNDLLVSQQLAKTYAELIRKRPVLEPVIQQLSLNETYENFLKHVSVSTVRDTQLLQVTVQYPQPQQAAEIANKIANLFITQMVESQGGDLSSTRESLRKQLATVEEEIRNTATEIQTLKSTNDGSSPEVKAAEQSRLQSTLSQYQLLDSQLIKNEQDLALAQVMTGRSVRTADPAVPLDVPVQPKVLLNVSLGTAAGLILAIAIVFLIEYIDDTVKTSEDLERAISTPTLGVVGVFPDGHDGNNDNPLLLASNPRLHFGEAYRTLRTNLQFATLNHPCRSLLVTSAGPGEGKSFTSSNLAVVLAQAGKRILIVDSDIRRPTLHKNFSVSNETGLTNLLLADDQTDSSPYVQKANYDGLYVLTSGPLPPNPSELLSSPHMARVVAALRQEFDLVLYDSPPMLAVADASILSALVDGVLLVVQAGRNRGDALAQVRDSLSRPGAMLLGTVLNRFSASRNGHYYYNYHYSEHDHQEILTPERSRDLVSR